MENRRTLDIIKKLATEFIQCPELEGGCYCRLRFPQLQAYVTRCPNCERLGHSKLCGFCKTTGFIITKPLASVGLDLLLLSPAGKAALNELCDAKFEVALWNAVWEVTREVKT